MFIPMIGCVIASYDFLGTTDHQIPEVRWKVQLPAPLGDWKVLEGAAVHGSLISKDMGKFWNYSDMYYISIYRYIM